MARQAFIEKCFQAKTLEIIHAAITVCSDYAAQGYDLTLRQVFYQFVSRVWISNTEASYKRLGTVISDARLAGLLDWSYIVDRTRGVKANSHWSSPGEIVRASADQYQLDRWLGQQHRIEVWIEKDALVGVIARVCRELDVAYFSCRGYASQSSMYRAAQRLGRYDSPIVLHLGDHDPSGIDMTRDIQDRLNLFGSGAKVYRIALTMEQIEELRPPPNPTKLSDSRARDYVMEYGHESWELDAIPPDQLASLVRGQVLVRRNQALWDKQIAREEDHKVQLREVAERLDT